MMLANYMTGYESQDLHGPRVKICGMRHPEHALVAARLGADMVGVVFANSKRQVSVAEARAVRQALNDIPSPARPLLVGVFVNEVPARMLEVAAAVGLDAVQMSGDETPEDIVAVSGAYTVLKALRFPAQVVAEDALAVLDGYTGLGLGGRLRILVDAYHEREYGGTGHVADWSLASRLASRHEIMLAGGLTPGNVAQAVAEVGPWGVDVSSGVELNGAKDPGLITEFIDAANKRVTRAR